MRVKDVDLLARTLRLEPGTTKNRDGREVTMTETIYRLIAGLLTEKKPEDFVFTRKDGTAVRDFRKTWWAACIRSGVGGMLCSRCLGPVKGKKCEACGSESHVYQGLIFHDLRRTAARNLRRAGVAEGVIQKIGGWRTRSVFERYAIVTQSDISDAMKMLETHQNRHSLGHSEAETKPRTEKQAPN